MAYLVEAGAKCQMCGTAEWEWEEDRFAYETITVQCHGCYLKSIAEDTSDKMAGSRVTLVPKGAAAAIRDTPKSRR